MKRGFVRYCQALAVAKGPTDLDLVEHLIARWLREALNLQYGQPPGGYLQVVGHEREKCARELARSFEIPIKITKREKIHVGRSSKHL